MIHSNNITLVENGGVASLDREGVVKEEGRISIAFYEGRHFRKQQLSDLVSRNRGEVGIWQS